MPKNIAVVVSCLNEGYQNRILRGIRDYAYERKVNVCHFVAAGGLTQNPAHDAGEYQIFHLPDLSRFDGVILMGTTIQSPEIVSGLISTVKAAGIPCVSIDVDFPEISASVGTDNYLSMRELTEHLISVHGCKSFAFLCGPAENDESNMRLRSVREVVSEHGLDLPENRIYQGDFTQLSGRRCARKLIQEHRSGRPLPDALICANDSMALAAITMLEQRQCRVPEDIIVTGFDEIDETKSFMPELTTIARPLYESGYQACTLLEQYFHNPKTPHQTIILDTNFIKGLSCGCRQPSDYCAEAVKKENFRYIMQYRNGIYQNNMIHCALAGCENIEEIVECLKPFVEGLRCDSFYLCLNDEWIGENDALLGRQYIDAVTKHRGPDYTASVSIPLAYKNGKFSSIESFAVSDLVPELWDSTDKGNTFFFFPLHFRDECLGYIVFSNTNYPLESPSVHAMMMTICTAIENVRKICCMNAVTNVLERLYVIDPLTGIHNRNGFARKTKKLYEIAIEKQYPVMVMFADMDGLKMINDVYGHTEGDAALKEIGAILQRICHEDEAFCRFGGDEFLLFKINATEEQGLQLKADFYREMEKSRVENNFPFPLEASIGFHIEVPTENTSIFQMIAIADQKMYEQKKKRKQSKYVRKD